MKTKISPKMGTDKVLPKKQARTKKTAQKKDFDIAEIKQMLNWYSSSPLTKETKLTYQPGQIIKDVLNQQTDNEANEALAVAAIQTYLDKCGYSEETLISKFADLLVTESNIYEFWRLYEYQEVIKTCLVLLTNPEISAKLPKFIQPTIGQDLRRILDFFTEVGNDTAQSEIDLYVTKNYPTSQGYDPIRAVKEYETKCKAHLIIVNNHII